MDGISFTVHPLGSNRPILTRRLGPLVEAVIPQRCLAELWRAPKPWGHERQAGVLSIWPEKSRCLLVWQIAVQNASDAMRGSEPEMSFAANNRESISH